MKGPFISCFSGKQQEDKLATWRIRLYFRNLSYSLWSRYGKGLSDFFFSSKLWLHNDPNLHDAVITRCAEKSFLSFCSTAPCLFTICIRRPVRAITPEHKGSTTGSYIQCGRTGNKVSFFAFSVLYNLAPDVPVKTLILCYHPLEEKKFPWSEKLGNICTLIILRNSKCKMLKDSAVWRWASYLTLCVCLSVKWGW